MLQSKMLGMFFIGTQCITANLGKSVAQAD